MKPSQRKYEKLILITGVIFIFLMIGACVFFAIRDNKETPSYSVSDIQNMDIEAININTADSQTLQLLPGIGEETANKIIQYREENGGFKSVEELTKVKGISEQAFQLLKVYITV